MCTWTAVKHVVAENALDDELETNDIEQGIESLMMNRARAVKMIEECTGSGYRTPPAGTGRPDEDDDNGDGDMGDEEEGEEEEGDNSDDERPEHSIEYPADYVSYSFFFFYLNPYNLVRPVKRDFLREWVSPTFSPTHSSTNSQARSLTQPLPTAPLHIRAQRLLPPALGLLPRLRHP